MWDGQRDAHPTKVDWIFFYLSVPNQRTVHMIEELSKRAIAVKCDVTRTEDLKAALSKTIFRAAGLCLQQRRCGAENCLAVFRRDCLHRRTHLGRRWRSNGAMIVRRQP